jgi:ketosteroid isomerase-like protein
MLLCTGLLSACAGSVVRDGSGAMTVATVEQLVRNSLHAWETGDEQLLLSTVDPDLRFAFPGTRTDAAGALRVFRYWQQHYRDTRVYIHWILVDGERFAAEYQFATTEKASGTRTAAGTVAIGSVRNGRIVSLKEYVDGRVSRLQAAGELPLEEGQEPFPWPNSDRQWPWSAPPAQ